MKPRKKDERQANRKRGPNLKIVGLFVLALLGLTLLLFSENTKPCVLEVPDSTKFQYLSGMVFANSQMNSLRVIDVGRAVLLGASDLELFGNVLVSLRDPTIEVTIANVNRVVQVSYPLADKEVTVNVLNLQAAAREQLAARIDRSNLAAESVESGIPIFTVRAHPVGSNPNSLTNAFIALAGSDLYYVEGYASSFRMLTLTLQLGLKGDGSHVRTELLMRGYALLMGGLNNVVGFSLTEFKEKTNGVEYVLKVVAVDSGEVQSRQVLVFETQKEFDSNAESARATFLERNEKACNAGQYVLGMQSLALDKLRTALQGL